MDEDWYTVEQQIRDRLTEARAAARIRALTEELAPTARRPTSVGIIRLASWVLARAMQGICCLAFPVSFPLLLMSSSGFCRMLVFRLLVAMPWSLDAVI